MAGRAGASRACVGARCAASAAPASARCLPGRPRGGAQPVLPAAAHASCRRQGGRGWCPPKARVEAPRDRDRSPGPAVGISGCTPVAWWCPACAPSHASGPLRFEGFAQHLLSVCGSVEHSACWRRAVSTLWADFVRDKRRRCIQGRTKGKGQRDTQRSSKTGRERNSEKDRDMHRRSETERSTEVETSRDIERQRHFLQALPVSQGPVCCVCISCSFPRKSLRCCGLVGGLSHSLPRDRRQWQDMGARGQRSLRVRKAVSRFRTYKRASDS